MRSSIAALAVVVGLACAPEESRREGEAPIPIAATHHEVVILTSPMKADMTFSMVGLRRRGEKDDGATRLKDGFEEKVESPHDGVVRRRFRVTLANGSDRAREYEIEIDYVSESTGEIVLSRRFPRIVVPPFTRTQVSGYTPLRAERVVQTEMRAVEVTEE